MENEVTVADLKDALVVAIKVAIAKEIPLPADVALAALRLMVAERHAKPVPIKTAMLRNGVQVVAGLDGKATKFANRTQAKAIADQIEGSTVYQPRLGPAFFVALNIKVTPLLTTPGAVCVTLTHAKEA